LSILTYNTPLLLAPVLIGFTCLRTIGRWKEKLIESVIIITLSVLMLISTSNLIKQKQAITIFSDPTIRAEQMQRYMLTDSLFSKVVNHRFTDYGLIMTSNYLKSLDPRFLILGEGGHPWHSIPGRGHLMLTTWILIMLSLWFYFKDIWAKKWKWIAWLFLLFGSLLVTVVTVDAPHATRSLMFFWISTLLSVYAIQKISQLKFLVIAGLVIETVIFIQGYFIYFPEHMVTSWQRGLDKALDQIGNNYQGSKIYLTNESLSTADLQSEQIYIYYLLYEQMSPSDFQKQAIYVNRDNANLIRVHRIGDLTIENDPELVQNNAIVIRRNSMGEYRYEK
jgi:hypothetical protein